MAPIQGFMLGKQSATQFTKGLAKHNPIQGAIKYYKMLGAAAQEGAKDIIEDTVKIGEKELSVQLRFRDGFDASQFSGPVGFVRKVFSTIHFAVKSAFSQFDTVGLDELKGRVKAFGQDAAEEVKTRSNLIQSIVTGRSKIGDARALTGDMVKNFTMNLKDDEAKVLSKALKGENRDQLLSFIEEGFNHQKDNFVIPSDFVPENFAEASHEIKVAFNLVKTANRNPRIQKNFRPVLDGALKEKNQTIDTATDSAIKAAKEAGEKTKKPQAEALVQKLEALLDSGTETFNSVYGVPKKINTAA